MFVANKDPTELPTELLEAEIASLYARISAETCEWLAMLAELERRRAYLNEGCRTCAQWLSIHCGVSLRSAQEHVRVALCLEELPDIRDAFAHGELTYSKVRALTRIAGEDNERELLDLARKTSAAQIEKVVRAYRRAAPPEELKQIHERRHATIRHDEDGSLILSARLAPEEGALVLKAMEQARDQVAQERAQEAREAEEGPQALARPRAGATNADALVRVAENAIAGAACDASGGDTHQLVMHVDIATLIDERPGRSEIEGAGVAVETARRLGCDAAVVAAIEHHGELLSVGRKTRSIPPALRRALRSRDGGCRFPGCDSRRFIDGHHVRHWAHGGETSLKNVVSLCRYHHRLVHEGGFTVERTHDERFLFRRANGKPIAECVTPPRLEPHALRRPPATLDPQVRLVGAPLAPCSATCQGEPMDLEHTIFCLMQRFNRPGASSEMRSAERIRA